VIAGFQLTAKAMLNAMVGVTAKTAKKQNQAFDKSRQGRNEPIPAESQLVAKLCLVINLKPLNKILVKYSFKSKLRKVLRRIIYVTAIVRMKAMNAMTAMTAGFQLTAKPMC
jgi:hypothetical protein